MHLCVVQDAHRYSAVVVKSYEPYSPSGRNALCVVQDAHRYSAVVFLKLRTLLSFRPQCTVCSARRAPLLCRRCCDSTHFCSQAKIRHRWCCCSKLRGRFHEDSRSVRHAEIETQNLSRMYEDTVTVRCKGWRCWLLSRPSRHGGSCGCKLMILKGAA